MQLTRPKEPMSSAGRKSVPQTTTRTAAPVAPGARDEDLLLVREILAGSKDAWESFVRRYAGLMAAVIRRYLHRRDWDDVRTIYVNALASLYGGKLATYEGRAALSTWLCVVTRSEVLNYLRHRFGRRGFPKGLRHLNEEDRLIYHFYYVQGLTLTNVLERLRLADPSWSLQRCLARLRTIEDHLDDRTLRRIAYDLHAQSTGASSGRLLEYLDHVRLEYSQNEGAHSPEYHLMEREARRSVDRLREILAGMDSEERMLLELRFERGWSAERIADELGLKPRRRVYTVLDRILRGLRRRMTERGAGRGDT